MEAEKEEKDKQQEVLERTRRFHWAGSGKQCTKGETTRIHIISCGFWATTGIIRWVKMKFSAHMAVADDWLVLIQRNPYWKTILMNMWWKTNLMRDHLSIKTTYSETFLFTYPCKWTADQGLHFFFKDHFCFIFCGCFKREVPLWWLFPCCQHSGGRFSDSSPAAVYIYIYISKKKKSGNQFMHTYSTLYVRIGP